MGLKLVLLKGDDEMSKQVTLLVDEAVYALYARVGQAAGGLSPEQVMADALFRLAGELSLQALDKKSHA